MSAYEQYLSDLEAIDGLDSADAGAREKIERDHREAGIRAQRQKDEAIDGAGKLNGRAIDLAVRARRIAQREGIVLDGEPAQITLTPAVLDDLERSLARAERNRDWLDRQAAAAAAVPVAAPAPVAEVEAPAPAHAGKKGCAALVVGAAAVAAIAIPLVSMIGSVIR